MKVETMHQDFQSKIRKVLIKGFIRGLFATISSKSNRKSEKLGDTHIYQTVHGGLF